MALSNYVGRTPHALGSGTTITRAVAHCRWNPVGEDREACGHCGAELQLRDRHVLVRTTRGGVERRFYLCDEACVADWVEPA